MSRYAQSLAQARLQALHALQAALLEAKTPDELRRCAVAILNAPDPCDLDDALPRTPGMSESSSESRGCVPVVEQHSDATPTSPLPPPTSDLPSPPTSHIPHRTSHIPPASPEDLATLRSLMSADNATIDRTLRAQPHLMSLLTPANLAAARELPP